MENAHVETPIWNKLFYDLKLLYSSIVVLKNWNVLDHQLSIKYALYPQKILIDDRLS